MAIAIMISTFGCSNGLILAGARVYYAMAKDGLFFQERGQTASHLQDAGGFADGADGLDLHPVRLRKLRTVARLHHLRGAGVLHPDHLGLFVLRRTRPDAERPYRAIGYPVLPAIYIVMALFIDIVLLRYKPQYTWPGLIIVLLGIPVYFLWSRRPSRDSRASVVSLTVGETQPNGKSVGYKTAEHAPGGSRGDRASTA